MQTPAGVHSGSMIISRWDVLFLSLKVRIPSGREYCIERREYRKINFNLYHLEIVYFFLIKLISSFFYGHNLFHLDNPVSDPVEKETISNPIQIQKFPISWRIGLQNPDPVHHWCDPAFLRTAWINSNIKVMQPTHIIREAVVNNGVFRHMMY